MKKEITISAKTVEEAVEKAVAELGAPDAEAIEYTVLEEAKKVFSASARLLRSSARATP